MIEVKNISKSYGAMKVLDDVSLVINKGETVSIIGHTGSGKSTLINCIAGLTSCDKGSIVIDGQTLDDAHPSVGMVFQTDGLFPHLTILQNMTLAPINVLGMSVEEAEEKAYELLDMVGMWERSHDYPNALSQGQRQRVAIARSLAMRPEYLLLDEPTSSLDPVSGAAVADLIRELKKQEITIVLITHKIDLACEVSDRIVFMHGGRICEQGTPQQMIDNPQNRPTQLYMKYCMGLKYDIESAQYDHFELNARIEFFCNRYRLSKEEIHAVQLVVEELLNLLPLNEGLFLFISKSATNSALTIDAVLEDKGENYLAAEKFADDLSYMIISGICELISESIDQNGDRNIHLEIKHQH